MNNHVDDVAVAFDILVEEIEVYITTLQANGSKAILSGDYAGVQAVLDRATGLTDFRDRALALAKEWTRLVSPRQGAFPTAPPIAAAPARTSARADGKAQKGKAQRYARLARGLRTPEETFYQPILRALVDAGGAAPMKTVLARVKVAVQGALREVDFQSIGSDPEMVRWTNTAQWARHSMVKEGLLKDNSPRGIWEISDAGRAALAEGRYPAPAPRATPEG